jgi:phage-related protein
LDGALYIILAIADGLTENLPAILTAVTNLILYLAERLTDPDTLVSLVDAALEIIIALATGLIENMPFLFEKIPTIIKNLVETIIRSAPKLFDAAVEIIKSLVKGIKDNAGLILNTASDLIFTIAEGLVKYFYMLVSKGKEIVDSVKSGFSQQLSGAKTWGKDLIDNFIGGIKEKWNDLKNTVKDVAQSIKDLIGFSEPKEGPLSNFHTYAPDMMDLFAQGVRENEHVVTDQIEKSFDFGKRTIEAAYTVTGDAAHSGHTVSGSYSPSVVININGADHIDARTLAQEAADAVSRALQNMTERRAAVYG